LYLVDTNVISAAALPRPAVAALVEWMDAHSASLFLSVVTVAEIVDGIAKSRREGATRKSANLSEWLGTVLHLYGDRILAFDVHTARIAGELADRARGQGKAPGLADLIIAATAERHKLTLLSRNLKHFQPLGNIVIDPFVTLPPG
jgi:predicted nucleic acid-binding protein